MAVIAIIVFIILFIGGKWGGFGGLKNQPVKQKEPASLSREKVRNSLSVPKNTDEDLNRGNNGDIKTPPKILESLSAPAAKTDNNETDSKVIDSLSVP